MNKAVKLLKRIFDALLVLVVIGAIVLLLAPQLLGAELLVVLSQSMEPTMPMGAVVVSRLVSASEIEVGDVITFRSPDPADGSDLITHRVVEVMGSGLDVRFRTQGDAVEEPDRDLVAPTHLVGRVQFSVPFLGYGVHFARTPLGFILLIGLPAALLVGGEIRSIVKAVRGKTASAPERTPPDLPIPEKDRSQAPLATQARDVASWEQVQALQAQVEALQAEVAILREHLEQISPDTSRLPVSEPPTVPPRPQQAPSGREVSDQQKEHAGHPILDRFPITAPDVKLLPPPKLTRPGIVERLAVSFASWAWLGVLAGLVAIFLLVNFLLPKTLSVSLNMYVAQPFLWSYLAFLAFLGWRYGLERRPPLSKPLVLMAILAGAFQVALFVIAGLFFGFDRSPYDHRPLVLLGNLAYVGTMLVGMEMSRAYLMTTFKRRNPRLAMVLLSLLFSFVSIRFADFRVLNSVDVAFRVSGGTFLPTLCQNLLASFLVLVGGPVASIAYRGTLLAFEWLSPIQPNLEWIVTALLGSIVPILGLLVIRSQLLPKLASKREAQHQEAPSSASRARVGLPAVLFVAGEVDGIVRTLRERKHQRTADASASQALVIETEPQLDRRRCCDGAAVTMETNTR